MNRKRIEELHMLAVAADGDGLFVGSEIMLALTEMTLLLLDQMAALQASISEKSGVITARMEAALLHLESTDLPCGHVLGDLTYADEAVTTCGACQMDARRVVELEPGVWLAGGHGDPPRTLALKYAKIFPRYRVARKALAAARSPDRPFENAKISPIPAPDARSS